MSWGTPRNWRVRAALVAVLLGACLLLPNVGWGQNAAEADAPGKGQPKPSPSDAQEPQDPVAKSPTEDDKDSAEDSTAGNVAESGTETEKTEAPEPQDEESVAPPTVVEQPAPTDDQPPAEGAQAPPNTPPDTPVGEGTEGAPVTPPEEPSEATTGTNTAESRAQGGVAGNQAEGGPGSEPAANIAEPPIPENQLPSPGAIAGPISGYVEPSIKLEIPEIKPLATRPAADGFLAPTRNYLDDRPLPPLDETETEDELIARNIERSLELLDLTNEQRPEEGIQIPLPSGLMTFKASDAFEFDRRNRVLKFIGNAEIIFDDIAIWGDLIEVDDKAAMAYAKGYVAIQNQDEILFCDEAYINYDTQTLEMFWVEGNSGSSNMEGNLYFEADRVWGTFDRMTMQKVKITTCDPYCGGVTEAHMSARKAIFKRDRSLVLHDVTISVREAKIGWVPVLAFPLVRDRQFTEEESDVQQQYGWNKLEGVFAKFAYTYSSEYVDNVRTPLLGALKLDISEKLGPGFGLRQDFYNSTLGVTTLRGWYQQEWPWEVLTFPDGTRADPKVQTEFELKQELNISKALNGSLNVTQRDRITPATTVGGDNKRINTLDSKLNLGWQRKKTNFTLNMTQSVNIAGGYLRGDGTEEPERESTRNSINLSFKRNLTKDLTFNVGEQYTSNKGTGSQTGLPSDQEGSFTAGLNWRGRQNSDLAGWQSDLNWREQVDYDGDKNITDRNQSVREERPSFSITAPTDLFGDSTYFNTYKLTIDDLVSGRRSNPDESLRMKLETGGKSSINFSRSSTLTTSLRAEQYWYDDGNAQYALRPNVRYTYKPDDWWSFNTTWNMAFQRGVELPPVQGDRVTYSNSMSYGLNFTDQSSWRWQLSSGYNFITHRNNSIRSKFDWNPSDRFGLSETFNITLNPTDSDPTFSNSNLAGYWHSGKQRPDNGYYTWYYKVNLTNDLEDQFDAEEVDLSFFRAYKGGWTGEATGAFRTSAHEPLTLSSSTLRNFVKRVWVRKVDCCTTWEAGWRSEIHEFYVNVHLNALPQYPSRNQLKRNSDQVDGKPNYSYDAQFMFPQEQILNDILQENFGFSSPL